MIPLIDQAHVDGSCCYIDDDYDSIPFFDCAHPDIDDTHEFFAPPSSSPTRCGHYYNNINYVPTSPQHNVMKGDCVSISSSDEDDNRFMEWQQQRNRRTYRRPPPCYRPPFDNPYDDFMDYDPLPTSMRPAIRKPNLAAQVFHDTRIITAKDEIKALPHFVNEPVGEFEVDDLVSPQHSEQGWYMKTNFLGEHFKPGKWDVICGRGAASYDHIGNKRLRILIAIYLPEYIQSKKRCTKTAIVETIVRKFQQASPVSGGFVRKDVTRQKGVFHWYSIGESAARERVGHAIRDCLSEPLRARSKEKLTSSRREAFLAEAQHEIVLSSLTSRSSGSEKRGAWEMSGQSPMPSPPLTVVNCHSQQEQELDNDDTVGLPTAPLSPQKKRRTTI